MFNLFNDDCIKVMKTFPDNIIDLTVTSPPYDNLRTYKGSCNWDFDVFKNVANELFRITKDGGVVVWVVGDATIKGSETGTSFRQALYFKDIGFNIHDTMIYKKLNHLPFNNNRYEQEFEYMFVFSKGKPNTFNPIKVPCKYAGCSTWGTPNHYVKDELVDGKKTVINETKIKGNIFEYRTGSTTKTSKIKHPAMFPIELAEDHIKSWSNEGDLVLDPFMGSGTTGVVSENLKRDFIGIELVKDYFDIAKERLENVSTVQ